MCGTCDTKVPRDLRSLNAPPAEVHDCGDLVPGPGPIKWATGTGSDVMKRIAAPMIGGLFTSFVLELVVYPAIYEIWRIMWATGTGSV